MAVRRARWTRWRSTTCCGRPASTALLEQDEVTRWLAYRANRSSTAQDYGVGFANETLKLLPDYLRDVRLLAPRLTALFDANA
jgi:hypothetical protein